MSERDLSPVLIIGATSDISIALAHQYASEGRPIHLAGRSASTLEADQKDLSLRYSVPVQVSEVDVTDVSSLQPFIDSLDPLPQIVVCMVGWMGDQEEQEKNPEQVSTTISTNFAGPAALMEAAARRLSTSDKPASLVGITSVAGDRGRARNYYYGAAKAGFSVMLSGLRQRLSESNITVTTVKLGFVETRMTEGLALPKLLLSTPTEAANLIFRAVRKRREVVYHWKWRLLMSVVRAIPEPIFKRLKF